MTTGRFDISDNGLELIREFESFRAEAYLDTGNVPTIGYGTIRYPNGVPVKLGDRCTRSQAETYLANDTKAVDAFLDKYVTVAKLNQNQFDALASFIYNVGKSAFQASTMYKLLKAGDFKGAAGQFDVWIYDNKKMIEGLKNRRAKEKALFLKPVK